MFYRNGPYDVCHCWYLHERRAGASSRKFPTYSLRGATLFDVVGDHDMQGAAVGWWPAANGAKAGGEVCFLRWQIQRGTRKLGESI